MLIPTRDLPVYFYELIDWNDKQAHRGQARIALPAHMPRSPDPVRVLVLLSLHRLARWPSGRLPCHRKAAHENPLRTHPSRAVNVSHRFLALETRP